MSTRLSHWPAVTDTRLDVRGRQVRILRVDSSRTDGAAEEPQLLVHGLGGSSVGFVGVMEGLSRSGPVVAVDLPGFGRTPLTDDDPLTVRGYVDFVLELADVLGWRRFTLHGNSMGGLIGTLIAAHHPERIQRLVLISPAFPPRSPIGLLLPSRATIDGFLPLATSSLSAAAMGAVGLGGPELSRRRNDAMLRLIFPDPDAVDRRLLHLMAADYADGISGEQRRRAMLAATRSIAAMWTDPRRAWRAVRAVQAPTLVLGGTQDALVPAKVLRAALAVRPDWTGHVLDDRRHALMLEDPEGYLRIVHEWQASAQAA